MNMPFARELRKAERHLKSSCPVLGPWITTVGQCNLIPVQEREIYESLVRAIAHQQLHAKAAESILGRLMARFSDPQFPDPTFPTAEQLSRMQIRSYRSCGFSMAKAEAIRGIAKAALADLIPTRALAASMSDEDLIEAMTILRGVGRWTVEMLLIFTLGRLDVMPVDDYGIKMGLKQLFQLDAIPRRSDFARLTDAWSPYRSVGAWYLWRAADGMKSS
jgi:DNA-3-methyladenine glycosylase II